MIKQQRNCKFYAFNGRSLPFLIVPEGDISHFDVVWWKGRKVKRFYHKNGSPDLIVEAWNEKYAADRFIALISILKQ